MDPVLLQSIVQENKTKVFASQDVIHKVVNNALLISTVLKALVCPMHSAKFLKILGTNTTQLPMSACLLCVRTHTIKLLLIET